MLFNVAQIIMLVSAVNIAIAASTFERVNLDAVKRHWRQDNHRPCSSDEGCQEGRFNDMDDGYASHSQVYGNAGGHDFSNYNHGAEVGVHLDAGLRAYVQGWSQLTPAFNELHTAFSSGASVEVAVQAAMFLRAKILTVSRQFSSCGCTASYQSTDVFQQTAVKFFSSFQLALQAGQPRYHGYVWETKFKPIFEQCSSAFVSIKSVAASIHVDLAAVLARAHINAHLFASVGLNLSALLNINLSVGALVHL